MESLSRIKEIYEKEREVKKDFDETFEQWKTFIIINNNAQHMEDEINNTYYHMGSVADGSFSARLFSENNLMFEADFMVEVAELPSNVLQMVDGKPGFYTLKNDGKFMEYLIGAAKVFQADPRFAPAFLGLQFGLMSHSALLGMSVKQLVDQVSGLNDGKQDVILAMWKACDINPEKLTCEMKTEFNGPATTQNIHFFFDGEHFVTLSFDVVVCARLSCWPPEAEAWEHRDRKWPSKALVADIIQEHQVHLVSKPSVETCQQQSDDWRLTFLAEKRLIKEHTPEMRLTYFIFKILFYKYFKAEEVDGKSMPSYLAKTTMHWLCEEVDPESWTEKNIEQNVKLLLKKLCGFLKEGRVPNYFVPGIDLLSSVPKRLVEISNAMDISKLLADPIGSLPTCFEVVLRNLNFFQRMCRGWSQYYRELAQRVAYNVTQCADDDLD